VLTWLSPEYAVLFNEKSSRVLESLCNLFKEPEPRLERSLLAFIQHPGRSGLVALGEVRELFEQPPAFKIRVIIAS